MLRRQKRYILLCLVLILLTACSSSKNEAPTEGGDSAIVPNENINSSEERDDEDTKALFVGKPMAYEEVDEGIRMTLMSQENEYRNIVLDKSSMTITVEEGQYKEISTTNKVMPIDGYMKGSYEVEALSPTKTTILFKDEAMNQHLDLLEIEHDAQYDISHVYLSKDMRYVGYVLPEASGLYTYCHDLALGETILMNSNSSVALLMEDGHYLLVPQTIEISQSNEVDAEGMSFIEQSELLTKRTSNDNIILEADAYMPSVSSDMVFDKVIANGIVMDPGTETYRFGYDIGIIGDKIAAISDSTLEGEEVIDATGLIVSPGFIDMLTFNLTDIGAKYKILDGVTTGLSNHGCTEDFDAFFAQYGRYGSYVNYGGAIYGIRIRWEAGLSSFLGKPSEEQIDYMAMRVKEEIEAGGIALAFSPEYYPGTTPEEIKAMMAVAAQYNIPTHFHGRYSSISGENTGIDSVIEILEYAKELDAKVQFMHLHSTGGTGMMDEALEMIRDARAEGYEVDYDIYPYDSWASQLKMQRFRDGWQERYGITYSDLQMAGSGEWLTEATFNQYRDGDGGLCIAYAMDEDEMLQALSEDYAMVGSDGCIEHETGGNDHFRGAGTFSRILGKYVRDENVFSLMDGLKKMTYNSAAHFEDISEAMALRGRIQVGCVADITIFDYRTIIDRSTPEAPATPSGGINYVLVSGQVGVRDGELVTSTRAGQPIANDFRE